MRLEDIHLWERIPARFWVKVSRSGPIVRPELGPCWLWTGSIAPNGYGQFGIKVQGKQRIIRAHRMAYLLVHGEIDDALDACHECDIRHCANPDHVWPGTRKQNLDDMTGKGRRVNTPTSQPGEANPMSLLTPSAIREIRSRCFRGEKQKDLAEEFGVHKATINDIVLYKTWKHIA